MVSAEVSSSSLGKLGASGSLVGYVYVYKSVRGEV